MDVGGERAQWRYLLTSHVFDKVRVLDMTLAEFEQLLGAGEVIEETRLGTDEVKELLLVLEWTRPLHVVLVIDGCRGEQRVVTVYEPDRDRWSADLRTRRR